MKLDANDIPEVAIAFMHETHLEELALLNELYALFDQCEQGEDVPALGGKIEALLAHTHAHFEREEEKMREMDFPPYPVHKQAHDEYLHQMDSLVDAWRKTGDLTLLAEFLKDTTPAWLQQHISSMDMVTANFFAMREGGQ